MRARDQRLLGGEVLAFLGVARVELRLAALEEPIARGAEALPQIVTLLAREVTGFLPARLQRLERSAVFCQSVESASDSASAMSASLAL